MKNKLKIYGLFLLLLLGISKTIAQQECWLDDLATLMQGNGNTDFGNFIKNHDDGFKKFKELYDSVGANTLRNNNNALNAYARFPDAVKDEMAFLGGGQFNLFIRDFGNFSIAQSRSLDSDFVKAWKLLDEAGVDASVRSNISEIQLVTRHYDEIINYHGGYNAWKVENWLSAEEMRSFTRNWASSYRQKLSNTQLSKFSKACTARWRNGTPGRESVFYGRNGGILNTQSSYPSISAEKGLGIHEELARRLPDNTQWPHTANCAECDAVNQALHEGARWSDIQIHTIDIRPNGTMTDVIQCNECLDIFDGMRVTSQ